MGEEGIRLSRTEDDAHMPKATAVQPRKTPGQRPERVLTARQERFVAEYVVSLNGCAAYKLAGYKVKSDAVAAVNASMLIRNPKVSRAIQTALRQRAERVQVSQDDVIRLLLAEATDHGAGSQPSARVKACELLGKHLGMFRESDLHLHQHQHTASIDSVTSDQQQTFIDALPLATRIQILEALRQAQQERERAKVIDIPKALPAPPDQPLPA
jgi:phage terminase small subunit